MKTVTVPRLELLGCLILSKLLDQVLPSLKSRIFVNDVFCWTDSEVVLCWIKGKEKTWKPWVENRVVKIRKVVDRENWNHIRGVDNPADISTSICSDVDLKRWFEGPKFLYDLEVFDNEFDVEERIKLVEDVVNSESKGFKSSNNAKNASLMQDVIENYNTFLTVVWKGRFQHT